mmetsp:Transcript_32701/g.75101  ORF Transcript_32701/g.75101 Transcript_32701/m.75101 type:complete len:263 (+) Transcript_32701:717-1505(+)
MPRSSSALPIPSSTGMSSLEPFAAIASTSATNGITSLLQDDGRSANCISESVQHTPIHPHSRRATAAPILAPNSKNLRRPSARGGRLNKSSIPTRSSPAAENGEDGIGDAHASSDWIAAKEKEATNNGLQVKAPPRTKPAACAGNSVGVADCQVGLGNNAASHSVRGVHGGESDALGLATRSHGSLSPNKAARSPEDWSSSAKRGSLRMSPAILSNAPNITASMCTGMSPGPGRVDRSPPADSAHNFTKTNRWKTGNFSAAH